MRTANWIVSFNLIMNTGEINKQTSYPSHWRDSFRIILQVSVHGELAALKALEKKLKIQTMQNIWNSTAKTEVKKKEKEKLLPFDSFQKPQFSIQKRRRADRWDPSPTTPATSKPRQVFSQREADSEAATIWRSSSPRGRPSLTPQPPPPHPGIWLLWCTDLLLCSEGVPADCLGVNDNSRGRGTTVVFRGFIRCLFDTTKAVLPTKKGGWGGWERALTFPRLIRRWSHLVHGDVWGQRACKNQCSH